jgi:hypothetical protein
MTMLKKFFTHISLFILFGLTAFLALGGCATIFSDGEDVITFNSNVDKTKVFLDGIKLGETPLTIPIERVTKNRNLKFTKSGYQTQELPLSHKFNMNFGMLLDLTGTALTLTPMGVDALSGNLIKYSPTEYHIEMEPEKTGDLNLFRRRMASMRFAAHNFPDIQRDLVIGEGEFLEGLKTGFQIPPAHKETFEEVLQANLDVLITADNGLEFWNRLNQLVKDDPFLATYHLG